MILKFIDKNSCSFVPEESDDLLTLRRVINKDDVIVSKTTRLVKLEKARLRPDKGERVKIQIALNVERISLDNAVDRLKVHGTILDSNNELVTKGTHHSLLLKIGDAFTLSKKQWTTLQKNLIHKKKEEVGFLLIAIDTNECGISRLEGTHLKILPNIYSGSSGKQYKTNFNIKIFFDEILIPCSSIIQKKDEIVIFGPGETKKRLWNHFSQAEIGKNHKIQTVDGIDSGGEDGIYIFTKSESMKEIMTESKLAKVSKIVDEIMLRANKKSKKFTMGFDETVFANNMGAIDSLLFSDKVFEVQEEDRVINFLNSVENKGAKIFGVDSTTDAGLQVSSLGGIVSLLRFAVTN